MIKLKCQYCGRIYGEQDMQGADTYGLEYSHGVCPDCMGRALSDIEILKGEPT